MRRNKILASWSSGKDSAWALHELRKNPDLEIVGLFTTINQAFERVSMHAVRTELLHQQARSLNLPLQILALPFPCSNAEYEQIMTAFVQQAKESGVTVMAFGDLFLEDIRRYREHNLAGTGIEPLFPLWGKDTRQLAEEMIDSGLQAVVTCVNPECLPKSFAGRTYDRAFLQELPKSVDPCGENGEFHTFVYAGPMFAYPINITLGEIVQRDGFVFADVTPSET